MLVSLFDFFNVITIGLINCSSEHLSSLMCFDRSICLIVSQTVLGDELVPVFLSNV